MSKKTILLIVLLLLSGTICTLSQTKYNKLSRPVLDSLILSYWTESQEDYDRMKERYVDVVINKDPSGSIKVEMQSPFGSISLNPRFPVISYFILEGIPVIVRTSAFDNVLAQYDPYIHNPEISARKSFYSEEFLLFLKETMPNRYRDYFITKGLIPVISEKGDTLSYYSIAAFGKSLYWEVTFSVGGYIIDIVKRYR